MATVLIADELAIREVLRDLLQDEGYAVLEAETGAEVLQAFTQQTAPDLVLMDARMPDESGLDVLRSLRQSHGGDLPVIVMTAYATSRFAVEAMHLGAHDYVDKPFDLDDVLLRVSTFLANRGSRTDASRRVSQHDRIDAAKQFMREAVQSLLLADANLASMNQLLREVAIDEALASANSNIDSAAQMLGISALDITSPDSPDRSR